jgi:hypothetical protein
MEKPEHNFETAFPTNASNAGIEPTSGMTLRDYFAGQALVGMLAFDGYSSPVNSEKITSEIFADSAYEIADAMLAARKEG